ncbi:Maf family protein [Candidatus Margulisiibacteriota bacterium]
MKLILASNSPRRKELLSEIIKDFSVEASTVDETNIRETDPEKFALIASELKAKDVGDAHPEAIVIGADTVVVARGRIFGKPKDIKEAKVMLSELSGRAHEVMTAIALYNGASGKMMTSSRTTNVKFKKLTAKDIEDYLHKVDVLDKAGAYAIQEYGEVLLENIVGDRDNVIGLPKDMLMRMIGEFTRTLRNE